MFEATGIPQDWVKKINKMTDEVWVPSKYLIKSFKDSGVKKKVISIPETIDINLFDPNIATPIQEIRKLSKYNFLSVFKWGMKFINKMNYRKKKGI
jgi:hypothetical protein